jgi:hypothetical protein
MMQRFLKYIVYIIKGGDSWMFEKEIKNKSMVELYDNRLHLLTSGIITGFKDKSGYIVIDYCIFFPIHHVAKITVHNNNNIHQDRFAQL